MIETVATPKQRGRRIGLLALLAAMIALGVTLMPMTAGAVHLDGIFEVDGNVLDDGGPGVDWENFQSTGGSLSTSFVTDGFNGQNDTMFTGGGSQQENDLSSWEWSCGSVPSKSDIEHAFASAYVKDGKLYVYFGADRYDPTGGTTNIGFWFMQNGGLTGGSGCPDGNPGANGFTFPHVNGDVFVFAEFHGGGGDSAVSVYEWRDGALNLLSAKADTSFCNPVNGGIPADTICGVTNEDPADPTSWPYADNQAGPDELLLEGAFFEGGINFTDLYAGLNKDVPCIGNFVAVTGSSQPTNGVLKDFANGQFNVCSRLVVKKTTAPAGDLQKFDFSVTGPNQYSEAPKLAHGEQFDSGQIKAGTYTVNETPGDPDVWKAPTVSCADQGGNSVTYGEDGAVSIAAGQTVTCTFVNTKKPRLKVVKQIENGDGSTFDISVGETKVLDNAVDGDADERAYDDGTYTVSETLGNGSPVGSDWTAAFSGDCNAHGQVTLAAGGALKTCTITNSLKHKPQLLIEKTCPDGAHDNDESFQMQNNDSSVGDPLQCGGDLTITLEPNTPWSITEIAGPNTSLANYTVDLSDGDCTGAGLPRGAATPTCMVVNTLKAAPKLIVQKICPDGAKSQSDTFGINNNGNATGVALTCGGSEELELGPDAAYHITETKPAGYLAEQYSSGCTDEGGLRRGATVTCTITNRLPSSIVVTKTADPISLPEPGGPVTYAVEVENTSATDEVTITSLVDDKFGDLDGKGSCDVPQTIAAGSSYSCELSGDVSGDAGDTHVNTVTASGTDDDGDAVSDDDDATVTLTDVMPAISVEKIADPTSVAEPGGDVGYTVKVANGSQVEALHLTSLMDDKFGDLDGKGTCDVPQSIAVGGSYTCTFTEHVSGNAGSTHVNTVTATGSDDDQNEVSANDDATVAFTNVSPTVDVTKDANVESVNEPGGDVIFTATVWNTSHEDVSLTSLVDSVYGNLDKNDAGNHSWVSSLCDTGTTLSATDGTKGGADTYACTFVGAVKGEGPATHQNEVTAVITDDEGDTATDKDTATVAINDVPPPPPPPPAPQIDLSVTKVDAPDPAKLNGQIGYTMLVRNAGPSTATGVTLADPLPAGTSFVSVSTTQGTCSFGGGLVQCSLGTIPAGGSVSVTLVVKATRAGVLTNDVTVVGQEPESNTANNRATAPTLVLTPLLPPKPKPVCSTLTVGPKSLRVGKRSTIAATVRNRGKAVKGAKVRVRGAGIAKSARTNARGKARITVRPSRPGIVVVSVPQKLVCGAKRIGVVGVFEPPVTG